MSGWPLDPAQLPSLAAWGVLCLAAALLWWPRAHTLSAALLAAAVGAGFALGLLALPALAAFALLGLAAWLVRPARARPARIAGHTLFVVVAFALGLHLMPGFHNPQLADGLQLSAGAAPMSLYLNFDKPLAGFWLLLCWIGASARHKGGGDVAAPAHSPLLGAGAGAVLGAGAIGAGAAALACLGLALLLGVVAWAPKWPAFAPLWAANNLLLVALTEEAMFRGYLQQALQQRWRALRHGDALAIAVSALAFGLVHAGGGARWVLLATLAGLAYGWAYRRGGLLGAVLAHFGLNFIHFTAFTYPMLA
ncbi:CPBP family intramembrane metalloprotease [Lysobacter sp. BMK333-48F3]|uniref:CPBP family intramembrane glutamic endopeptidase n=1 Tax=Lysobacter sp. BMK333-48F3 TaxID=2867962 RepID=UPI001C8CE536|nr:CPBP family intramembrane glutamic endopeptidase [Lysobacter sp. BMK333-48F3]MBX9400111.1 CPBP family intramembrane metalloprotease [Lysobacter sp. BMK333-48F3]